MAKKMKVVVRRKNEGTTDVAPPGACFMPFTKPPRPDRKRPGTPVRKRTAAASTSSQSSSTDPLAHKNSPATVTDFAAWESTESPPVFPTGKKRSTTAFSVGGESSTQPLSWGSSAASHGPLPPPSTPNTPNSSEKSVESLLALPSPIDRSDRRRLAYEKEKRQKGVYQGELEPLGKRGQEAEVAKNSPTVQDAPQLRSFTGPPDRKNFAGKQVDLVLPAPKEDESAQNTARRTTGREGVSPSPSTPPYASKQLPQRTRSPVMATPVSRTLSSRGRSRTSYSDDISDSSSQLSSSQLLQREYLPPVQLHTETGRTFRGDQPYPVDNNHSSSIPQAYRSPENDQDDDDDDEDDDDDDDSTQSDEELRQMQADLMPSMSKDIDIDQHVTPDSFSRPPSRNRSISTPSPVAASAAAAAATLQQDPSKQVERLNDEAMDAVQEGRFNDAVELFGQVLALQKSHYGSKHPTVASAYHNLGTVQAKRAATLTEDAVAQQLCRTAALEAFQSAARRARDSLGRSHPNVAVSLVRIGFLLLHSKQYTNSLITFAEALRIRLAAFGKHHALTANLYNNLGVCHMHMEQFDQGRRALHTGLEIQRKLCAESDATAKTNGTVPWLELADTLFNIGGLCLEWIRKQGPDLRRAQESEDSFAEAYEIRLRILGPDDPSTVQVRELHAMARSIPRPRPRSNSPGPRRWRSEEKVALYTPPSTPLPEPPSVERRTISPLMTPLSPDSEDARRFVYATPNSRRYTTPDSRPSAQSRPSDEGMDGLPSVDLSPKDLARGIFRSRSEQSEKATRSATPPVLEVTVSQEQDGERSKADSTASRESGDAKESGATRIYMASHLVPGAPIKPVDKTEIQEGLKNASFDDTPEVDTSDDLISGGVATRLFRSYDYDNEENCLISDSGVDSEHGRVHFPLAWNKAGLKPISELPTSSGRDLVVTRPFRNASFSGSPSVASEKWGSETVNMGDVEESFSTGNRERDDIMSRAKAILDSHDSPQTRSSSGSPLPKRILTAQDSPQTRASAEQAAAADLSMTVEPSRSTDPIDEEFDLPKDKAVDEDLLMEDGLASLCGNWTSSEEEWKDSTMISDPMNYLPNIHEQACKLLHGDNFVDAVHLFDVVLQCQKRRNGTVHADVASALYNLGIAQLRSRNHGEALKAFEEAARIRKGALGRDHPQVAVSLVKVGITLLLLHRFEEALWSFREALSVRRHALGPLHPSTARIYNNIGCVHVEFNEFREARRAFEAALDIQRNALCHEPESGPLMFGAATTLCNLGYLYRYRGLHAKAALVLKEAVDLQETVLGRSHATVLSTLDNLADSCASSGQAGDALRHYNMILTRFRVGGRSGSQKVLRAEAVLLYKMSRVHRQRNDYDSQLDTLKLALRSVRALSDPAIGGAKTESLERRIQYDIRSCRERIEKSDLKWV